MENESKIIILKRFLTSKTDFTDSVSGFSKHLNDKYGIDLFKDAKDAAETIFPPIQNQQQYGRNAL